MKTGLKPWKVKNLHKKTSPTYKHLKPVRDMTHENVVIGVTPRGT